MPILARFFEYTTCYLQKVQEAQQNHQYGVLETNEMGTVFVIKYQTLTTNYLRYLIYNGTLQHY